MYDNMLSNAANFCNFTGTQMDELKILLAAVKNEPARRDKFQRAYEHFWHHTGDWENALKTYFDTDPEDDGTLLCVALAGIPLAVECFRQKGLPMGSLYEALPEIRIWMENFYGDYGHIGMELHYGFSWYYSTLASGVVLRFGRLEYNHGQFYPDITVLRSKTTGERRILLNSNGCYDAKGRIAPDADGDGAFKTSHVFGIFYDKLQGHLINRVNGSVARETSDWDLREWEYDIQSGDRSLYLHIPAGEPLTPEGVEDSLRRMKRYYCSENSGFYPKAVICTSWLLDPQLQEILPESSNLVKFQRRGYMLPSTHLSSDTVRRVFGLKGVKEGIRSVPWNTLLRQRIGADLDAGIRYAGGRFVIFMDEIED